MVVHAQRYHMDENQNISHKRALTKIELVFVVAGHCASEILIARIIGELYAQVSFFPTRGVCLPLYIIGECMNDRITLKCCM